MSPHFQTCKDLAGQLSLKTSSAGAVQSLLQETQASHRRTLLHYFFRGPEVAAVNLFRSLVRQALQLHLDRNIKCLGQTVEYLELCFGADNRTQDVNELVDLLLHPLMRSLGTSTICVDGIEDCSYDEQQKIWAGLSRLLKRQPFNFVVTLTDSTAFQSSVAIDFREIRLDQGLNTPAIAAYVDERLRSLAQPDQILADDPLRNWAREQLLTKSDGMYVRMPPDLRA